MPAFASSGFAGRTNSSCRLVLIQWSPIIFYNFLSLAGELAANPDRLLFYATSLDAYLNDDNPLLNPILLDHRGDWRSLVDLHPTSGYLRQPVRLPRQVLEPLAVVSTLRPLARRNAAEVRPGQDFRSHLERLVRGVEGVLQRPQPPATKSTRPRPRIITGQIDIEMALISAGEFLMGSPESEGGRGDDEYQHRVRITEHLKAKYPNCSIEQVDEQVFDDREPSHTTWSAALLRGPWFFFSHEELAMLFHPATKTARSERMAVTAFTELEGSGQSRLRETH